MSPAAIIIMVVAMAILWGGLLATTLFLVRHPLEDVDDDEGYGDRAGRARR